MKMWQHWLDLSLSHDAEAERIEARAETERSAGFVFEARQSEAAARWSRAAAAARRRTAACLHQEEERTR